MSESYYAIEKFAEAERSLVSIIEAMPIKRKAIDIYKEKNNVQRAKDTFTELESTKRKLLDTVRELGLLCSLYVVLFLVNINGFTLYRHSLDNTYKTSFGFCKLFYGIIAFRHYAALLK